MENLVNLDLDIKQEDDDANNEIYSTKIIAAKIYSIAELMDNSHADISHGYRGVHPDKSGEEENVHENLFEVKEEDLELISSVKFESVEIDKVQPNNDSTSASMPFRVHDAHNHNDIDLKQSKDDNGHTDANCEEHLRKDEVYPEKSVEEENLYEDLFEVKEEDLELSTSDNLESEAADNDSASVNTSFGQHPEQDATSELQYSLLCPFCGLEFSGHPQWRRHLNVVHKFKKPESLNMLYTNDTVSCLECKVEMKSKRTSSLQWHRMGHLPYNPCVKCKLCTKRFIRASNHKEHLLKRHNTQNPKKTMKRKKNEDLSNSKANVILLCPYCGLEFSGHPEWRHHLSVVHKFNNSESLNMLYTKDRISCRECKVEMTSKCLTNLQRHRMGHLPYNRYVKCKLCANCFRTAANHKRHMERCHNENRNDPNLIVLCPFCGKEFPDSAVWEGHLNVMHEFNKRETLNMDLTKDKSKCQECNIEIKSKVLCKLQQHRIRHLPYKRFVKCKLCEVHFDNKFRYRMHIVRCKRK